MDTRKRGKLTKKLLRLAAKEIDSRDVLDPADVPLRSTNGSYVIPDCQTCTTSCCVHEDPGSGILLSLRDIAHLVDSGYGDLIVGTFTFKKRKGKYTTAIDRMPRLAKKRGNCVFYDPATKRCVEYGVRPTICRRFPYEVDYRKKKKSEKPFAEYLRWSPCPTEERTDPEAEAMVLQMVRDAVEDENVSFEDAMLLPDCLDKLRKIGFDRFLPPPEECPDV